MKVNLTEQNDESRWEDMGLPVHNKINQGFRDIIKEEAEMGDGDRFIILNCNDFSIEENFDVIKHELTTRYELDINNT